MRKTIVFDVNETLLDLGAMRPLFAEILGDGGALEAWFGQLLRNAMVATILDAYQDFGALGREALAMTAERLGRQLIAADADRIMAQMRRLPPHPDVVSGLERLHGAGFRLAALSNNPAQMLDEQLENAGLRHFFARTLSVEAVRRYKPAPAVYQEAAAILGIPPAAMRLVAAHDWDVAGALNAGCAAAFVARPGAVLGTLRPCPDIVERDIAAVAERIVAEDLI